MECRYGVHQEGPAGARVSGWLPTGAPLWPEKVRPPGTALVSSAPGIQQGNWRDALSACMLLPELPSHSGRPPHREGGLGDACGWTGPAGAGALLPWPHALSSRPRGPAARGSGSVSRSLDFLVPRGWGVTTVLAAEPAHLAW